MDGFQYSYVPVLLLHELLHHLRRRKKRDGGRGNKEGRREKGEGRREKGERRRAKGEGSNGAKEDHTHTYARVNQCTHEVSVFILYPTYQGSIPFNVM